MKTSHLLKSVCLFEGDKQYVTHDRCCIFISNQLDLIMMLYLSCRMKNLFYKGNKNGEKIGQGQEIYRGVKPKNPGDRRSNHSGADPVWVDRPNDCYAI